MMSRTAASVSGAAPGATLARGATAKKKKPKKQTLRQVVANQLLEGGARAFEDEDADDAEPKDDGKKSYVEEQADLKRAFKDAAEGSDGDDESSDSDSDPDFEPGDRRRGRRHR